MQRVVADKLLGDAVLDGIGLTARMLIVQPESTMGSRPFREAPPECASVLRDYADRMLALLTRPVPSTAPDTQDVLDPPVMTLTPDARSDVGELPRRCGKRSAARWRAASDPRVRRQDGRARRQARGRAAVYADPDAMQVDAEAMACGIALAQHYAAEMLRLQGGAAVSPDLRLAARLLAWWQAGRTRSATWPRSIRQAPAQ